MSDEIIELENILRDDGMCVVHLMSNFELTMNALWDKYNAPADATVELTAEAGVHYLRARWMVRGAVRVAAEGWPMPKMFVIWNLALCDSVKKAMLEAAEHYQDIYGTQPEYAFIRKMPRGIENGVEVGDMMLFEADWMVRKCVAVGWKYAPPLTPPQMEEHHLERGR
jgi:hypothetical protein